MSSEHAMSIKPISLCEMRAGGQSQEEQHEGPNVESGTCLECNLTTCTMGHLTLDEATTSTFVWPILIVLLRRCAFSWPVQALALAQAFICVSVELKAAKSHWCLVSCNPVRFLFRHHRKTGRPSKYTMITPLRKIDLSANRHSVRSTDDPFQA